MLTASLEWTAVGSGRHWRGEFVAGSRRPRERRWRRFAACRASRFEPWRGEDEVDDELPPGHGRWGGRRGGRASSGGCPWRYRPRRGRRRGGKGWCGLGLGFLRGVRG